MVSDVAITRPLEVAGVTAESNADDADADNALLAGEAVCWGKAEAMLAQAANATRKLLHGAIVILFLCRRFEESA